MQEFLIKYSSALLFSFALALIVFTFLRQVVRLKAKQDDDDWRDPPPLIFKLFKPIVKLFASDVRGWLSQKSYEKYQTRLSTGGMNYAILPEELFMLKVVCGLFMLLVAYILFTSQTGFSVEVKLFLIALGPLGYVYPDIWLSDKITQRRRKVAKDFPFLLDLLVLSMRAGLNYSTSLGQAISNLPNGPVKEEFGKLLREIRAGKVRRDALLDLAKRMDIKSINNFVSAINQAEETGGEIVDVLTQQAEQRRSERFNEAEAAANKAPIKMLLPLVLFLFPIIFMLIAFILVVKLEETGYLPPSIVYLIHS